MGTAISRKDSAEVSYSQVVSLLTFCLSTQPLGQPDGSSAPCQLRTRHSSQNNDPNLLHDNPILLHPHHPWQDLPAPPAHPPHLLCVSGLQTQTKHCHHSDRRSDIELGGTTPLSQASKILRDQGAQFSNAFVTIPICCPSRGSILTGRYLHNTGVRNNTVSGGCSSSEWREGLETQTFAAKLQKTGYTTMYAGKYLNQYGRKAGGGLGHVPKGWHFWAGLVGNSRYYNYTLSLNGKPEVHKDSYPRDYLTDVIRRKAIQFLNKMSRSSSSSRPPFLMVLAPPACHAPFTPAPQYKDRFKEIKAPRTPAFDRDQAA